MSKINYDIRKVSHFMIEERRLSQAFQAFSDHKTLERATRLSDAIVIYDTVVPLELRKDMARLSERGADLADRAKEAIRGYTPTSNRRI